MKIMVVGGGGREHAIIKKIKKSPLADEIFVLPGNAGMKNDATCVDIGAKDLDGIVSFAKENAIDYAIVAPDDPLVLGATEVFEDTFHICVIEIFPVASTAAHTHAVRLIKVTVIRTVVSGKESVFHSFYRQVKTEIFPVYGDISIAA